MPDTSIDATPPRPDLEFRVGRLEQDMGDVKAILGQMLPLIVRIDATMPHLATKAELQAAFGTLDGKIGTLDGKIGTLDGKIGTLDGKIGTLDGKIGTLDGKIGTLDGKIGTLDGKIGTLDGKIGDLRAEMHSELSKLRAELADKPGKTYLWMVLGVLIMAYTAGLAGLAILK
jgi:chromosome segregation ATPase